MKHLNSYSVGLAAMDNVEGWTSGLDAISATLVKGIGLETYDELHEIYKARAMETGERMYHTSIGNYNGRRYGPVFVGKDRDVAYVAATGPMAADVFCVVEPVVHAFKRLDFQITVKLKEANEDYVIDQYKLWNSHPHPGQSPKVSKLIQSATGCTLYLGTRQNSRLYRIYDKSTWYNAPLGTYIRFEVENLRDTADREGFGLTYDEKAEIRIASSVFSAFHKADIRVPVELLDKPQEYSVPQKTTARDEYLAWLKTSVMPVVRHLCQIGEQEKVAEMLGLQAQMFSDEPSEIAKFDKP